MYSPYAKPIPDLKLVRKNLQCTFTTLLSIHLRYLPTFPTVYDVMGFQRYCFCSRKSAFHCWLENMKPFFQDENPDLSEGEIMKLAMKQWRETPKEEKQVWENASKASLSTLKNGTNESGQGDDTEVGEKKRKRNDEEGNVEESVQTDILAEKENISKKVKTFDKQKVSSKLEGFAFSK